MPQLPKIYLKPLLNKEFFKYIGPETAIYS